MSSRAVGLILGILASGCGGNEGGKMLDNEITELGKLTGSQYIQRRDSLLKASFDLIENQQVTDPAPIPALPAALKIRAKQLEESGKFTNALLITNVEYLDPRSHVRQPNTKQLTEYLVSLGLDKAPLAEEFLFQLPEFQSGTSVGAASRYLAKVNPDRAGKVATEAFRKFKGNDDAQKTISISLEETNAKQSSPMLWEAYRNTKAQSLRHSSMAILAGFADPDMKSEAERILNTGKSEPEEIAFALHIYCMYLQGDRYQKLTKAFQQFKPLPARLEIAKSMTPTDKSEASVQEKLIKETKEKPIVDELRENLDHYRRMAGDR